MNWGLDQPHENYFSQIYEEKKLQDQAHKMHVPGWMDGGCKSHIKDWLQQYKMSCVSNKAEKIAGLIRQVG